MRDTICEERWFQEEWSAFLATHNPQVQSEGIQNHARVLNLPHREFLPQLLNYLGLKGNALEIGVRDGYFSRHFLDGRWQGKAYHGIDPRPLGDPLCRHWLEKEPRFHFHIGRDHQHANRFQEEYFDFVYIDSVHNYPSVRDTINRWLPKIRSGGILAGHDFCRALKHSNEWEPNLWPRNANLSKLEDVPICGYYRCNSIGPCYHKDRVRLGKVKWGFGGVALAVFEGLEAAGMALQITMDGRPVDDRFLTHEGSDNPSWWAVKP